MPQAPPVMDDRPLSADRVPTLTEVVELDLPVRPPVVADDCVDTTPPPEDAAADEPSTTTSEDVGAPLGTADVPVEPAAGPVPPSMGDDFVLTGLEADVGGRAGAADVAADVAAELAADDSAGLPAGIEPERAAAVEVAIIAETPATQAPAEVMADAVPREPSRPPVVQVPETTGFVAVPQPTLTPAVAEPASAAPLPVVDAEALVGQVLSELMPRIDMLLESRLREALAPALARAADALIRDTRENLAVAMRDLVHEAVDRALQRRADL